MIDLGSWMNKILIGWGVDPKIANTFDETIIAILMIFIAVGLDYLCQAIFVGGMKRLARRTSYKWDTLMVKHKVIHHLIHILPGILMYMLLPMAFVHGKTLLLVSQKICVIYMIFALLLALNSSLLMLLDILSAKEKLKDRPMKGFIQIFRVVFYCVVVIVIISILINKSPLNLITGLGAFTAVLMLVFKDTILGLVAGVMISEDDMLRIGDWIEMPQNNINGTVTDISLDVVKVQNFDNTIVTVPPYSLVSGSFINWRGMSDSGGRRIMREYTLKLDYIKPCTPEFLEKMKAFDKELAQFITEKQKQAADGKVANTDNPEGLVNGTIDTNLGLFRAYMVMYLRRHPFVSKELLLMVRTLPPVANGLPVQIYCFSSNKNWPSYESIQAEIMEHFVSVLPAFELYPFQNADARDMILSSYIESAKVDLSTLIGIPWHTTVTQSNPFDVEKQEAQDSSPKA